VPAKDLRGLADAMQRQIGSGVAAVVSVVDGKAAVVVSVSDDLKDKRSTRSGCSAPGSPSSAARAAAAAPTSPKAAAPTAPAPTSPSQRSSARWRASRRRRSDHHAASASTAWRVTLPSPLRAVIFRS
jgi:alanyl-tRNA synthetase